VPATVHDAAGGWAVTVLARSQAVRTIATAGGSLKTLEHYWRAQLLLSTLRKQMHSGRTFWPVSTISPMEIIVRWHEPFACMRAAFDAGYVEACQRLTP
jgi:hypothetical protein